MKRKKNRGKIDTKEKQVDKKKANEAVKHTEEVKKIEKEEKEENCAAKTKLVKIEITCKKYLEKIKNKLINKQKELRILKLLSKGTIKVKEKKRNKKWVKLEKSASSTLAVYVILSLFLIFIIVSLSNRAYIISEMSKKKPFDREKWAESVWDSAFIQAEKNKIGVIFNPINTTGEQYKLIRNKCYEYLENSKDGKQIDALVDVDTTINEEQYIDGEAQEENKTVDDSSETEPVYLDDMVLVRYINKKGALRVVIGILDKETEEVTIMRQDEVATIINNRNQTKENDKIDIKAEKKEDNKELKEGEENYTYENDYIKNVSNSLIMMLEASSGKEIKEAEKEAINYFTLEGKRTVFGDKEAIHISEGCKASIVCMMAGKSDYNKQYKDRVYMQLKIETSGEENIVHVIVKMNKNLKVYDLDII